MKVSRKDVAALVASLYEAAADQAQWELFLKQLTMIVKGGHAALLLLDYERAHVNVAVSSGVAPEAQCSYDEYYSTTDEWARRSQRLIHSGWVGTGQMICPDEVLLRSEFYNDFLRKHDMFHECAGIIDQTGSSIAAITIVRPRRAGAFGEDTLQFMKFLMPHMQRAVQIHSRIADLYSRAARTELALDSISFGIVFINARGALVQLKGKDRTLGQLIPPVLGFIICFYIWIHLSKLALEWGSVWMIAGIAYGAWKTRGFQSNLVNFDVPPEE